MAMVHSFVYVNDLFYKYLPEVGKSWNLWFTKEFLYKNTHWCSAGLQTFLDLPLSDSKIDVTTVKSVVADKDPSWYLCCSSSQKNLSRYLPNALEGSHQPHPVLLLQAKSFLQRESTSVLSLDNWCEDLVTLPYNCQKSELVFLQMLVACKVNKFWEINYKILARILATPKIISSA